MDPHWIIVPEYIEYSPPPLFMSSFAIPSSFYGCLVCVWETIKAIKGKSEDKKSEEHCPTIVVVSFSVSGWISTLFLFFFTIGSCFWR